MANIYRNISPCYIAAVWYSLRFLVYKIYNNPLKPKFMTGYDGFACQPAGTQKKKQQKKIFFLKNTEK